MAVVATAGVVCSIAPAAAMGESRVTVWNFNSIGPGATADVSKDCPSGAPYVVGVTAEGSGQGMEKEPDGDPIATTRVKIEAITLANYPASSSIKFSNTTKGDENPVVKVSMKITLECSNVNPGKFPKKITVLTVARTPQPPGDNRYGPRLTVRTYCPGGTRIDDGAWAEYDWNFAYLVNGSVAFTDRDVRSSFDGHGGKSTEIKQFAECLFN
ncbi:hypothetical protein FHS43_005510 [Streptosporangium becharense]|uniref:Uncharacterized protein n=1 Tax=Streptosporangium becharense TaxID=1816182 RepID=A0A7W9MDW7_9ACTN|nr:hypothetical protein [Streptosporangium becharense]MBB2914198.1 hypothetical protein [Streptosporangium becharense]MBB5817225.1 hypothetical protein [Streptosporangium becharense]